MIRGWRRGGNKYGAVRTEIPELPGRTFDSKAEAARAQQLIAAMDIGDISNLSFQPRYTLSEWPRAVVTFDFQYDEGVVTIVEDVKGDLTEGARVRFAWFVQLFPQRVLRVVKRKGSAFVEWDWMGRAGRPKAARAPKRQKALPLDKRQTPEL